MAKRVTISLKDAEYEEIELIAKKRGIKVIDVINERFDRSVSHEFLERKQKEIEIILLKIKNEKSDFYELFFKVIDVLLGQSLRANEFINHILESNQKDVKSYSHLDDKSKEKLKEIMQEMKNFKER